MLENGKLPLSEGEKIKASKCDRHLSSYMYKLDLGKFLKDEGKNAVFENGTIDGDYKVTSTNVPDVRTDRGGTRKKRRNRKGKSRRR
jgi:hypothetical protein